MSKEFSISKCESTRIAYFCPSCLTATTIPVLSHLRGLDRGGNMGKRGGRWGRGSGVEGAGREGIGGGKSVTIWVRNCFCLIESS